MFAFFGHASAIGVFVLWVFDGVYYHVHLWFRSFVLSAALTVGVCLPSRKEGPKTSKHAVMFGSKKMNRWTSFFKQTRMQAEILARRGRRRALKTTMLQHPSQGGRVKPEIAVERR